MLERELRCVAQDLLSNKGNKVDVIIEPMQELKKALSEMRAKDEALLSFKRERDELKVLLEESISNVSKLLREVDALKKQAQSSDSTAAENLKCTQTELDVIREERDVLTKKKEKA